MVDDPKYLVRRVDNTVWVVIMRHYVDRDVRLTVENILDPHEQHSFYTDSQVSYDYHRITEMEALAWIAKV